MTFEESLAENERLAHENKRLGAENEQLRDENAALKKQHAKLETVVAELQARLEEIERASKRQAAPFSKGKPKPEPKKPGRKPGHVAAQRARPRRVDETLEAALSARCPACGGSVKEERVAVQYQVDLPPVEPVVTRFNVHIGKCRQCGQRVQGRHPQQTSDALGAAAVQLGPRALGLAAELKHEIGVPYGKIAGLYERGFGLRACRAAFARADQRLAKRCLPMYGKLIEILRESSQAFVDETGWKVGGHSAWLWVFTNEVVSLYWIDPTRGHGVVERILGADFAGRLHSDCFPGYNPLTYNQQKCLQHLLRRCDGLVEVKSGPALKFSLRVAALFRGAIHLKHRREKRKISAHGFRVARGKLEAALDRLLAGHYTDPENKRLAKLLRKHREQLFPFLYERSAAPTNAQAEREIRPAVAVRKMSACNRSPVGSATHAVLTSVIRTCRKHDQSFLQVTIELLQHPNRLLSKVWQRLFDLEPGQGQFALPVPEFATSPPSST
jgi:transposase